MSNPLTDWTKDYDEDRVSTPKKYSQPKKDFLSAYETSFPSPKIQLLVDGIDVTRYARVEWRRSREVTDITSLADLRSHSFSVPWIDVTASVTLPEEVLDQPWAYELE